MLGLLDFFLSVVVLRNYCCLLFLDNNHIVHISYYNELRLLLFIMTNQSDVLATIEANLQQAMQRKMPREQVKESFFKLIIV